MKNSGAAELGVSPWCSETHATTAWLTLRAFSTVVSPARPKRPCPLVLPESDCAYSVRVEPSPKLLVRSRVPAASRFSVFLALSTASMRPESASGVSCSSICPCKAASDAGTATPAACGANWVNVGAFRMSCSTPA